MYYTGNFCKRTCNKGFWLFTHCQSYLEWTTYWSIASVGQIWPAKNRPNIYLYLLDGALCV